MDLRAGWSGRSPVISRCVSQARRLLNLVHDRLVSILCIGLASLAVLSVIGAVLVHEWTVLRTSTWSEAYPPVLYGLMPSAGTSPVRKAPGAAGGDFAQVFTSAQALRHGESAYFPSTPEFKDRFGRPAGYPPLTNWLYVPLTYLPYYHALLVQIIGTLVGFYLVTALLLWRVGLRRHIFAVLLAQTSLYLLTPIGFTHVERGQFDLIVAAAIALCMGCVFSLRSGAALAAASGLLGTLKWTSVAFLGCFCVAGMALGGRERRRLFALVLALMVVGTAVFWKSIPEYWVAIQMYEINAKPRGLSFTHFLPRMLVKVLPVIVTSVLLAAALFVSRKSAVHRQRMLYALSAPFSMMLLNLDIGYGTVTYEYHTVTTLGVLPGLVVWIEREPFVPRWFKALVTGTFGVLLCIAFRTFQYAPPFDSVAMAKVYAAFTALFFAFCAYVVFGPMRGSVSAEA
jgi:hypothetical protein